jgi:hypothetical protein
VSKTLVPNRPTALGKKIGRYLARLTEKCEKSLRLGGRIVPEPCGTCAFRRGTIPNGCEETVSDAMKAVAERDRTFMCHERPNGEAPTKVCGGFAIVTTALALSGAPTKKALWEYGDL